jgi:rubrerythrin
MQDKGRYSYLEIIYLAIKIEDKGYNFYSALSDSTIDYSRKKLFSFLAGQEKAHRETFQRLQNDYKGGPQESDVLGKLVELIAIADKHTFLSYQVAEIKNKARTMDALIEVAIDVESDTIHLFTEFAKFFQEDDKDIIGELIKQEESHKELLTKLKAQFK